MTSRQLIRQLAAALPILALAGCNLGPILGGLLGTPTPPPSPTTGALVVAVEGPVAPPLVAGRASYRAQALEAFVTAVSISVMLQGGASSPVESAVSRDRFKDGAAQHRFEDLKLGAVVVRAVAYDGATPLSEGTASARVEGGKTVEVKLRLAPLAQQDVNLEMGVDGPIPTPELEVVR